tara:strand:- start:1557 stop:2528 length:972 start_codon:yes stop_codon:yes gene_type:complete
MYSLLTLPKIFSKLILFVFFISLFFTLSKYEENNEILIFWTYGVKKIEFINKLILFSFFYFFISLLLNVFLVPKTQDLAKSFIRDSSIDYFPSLIKTQHFNDTASKLTIFVENKKANGLISNIFIKEINDTNSSKIISAREGLLAKKSNTYYLILFNGNIVNVDKKNTNIIKFDRSEFNLSKFGSKTTVFPKIQETDSLKLANCLNMFILKNISYTEDQFYCNQGSIDDVLKETYKRLVLPFYIMLITFITSCLIIKSKTQTNFSKFKSIIFIIGFLLIVFSEASSSYLYLENLSKMFILLIPFVAIIFIYLIITNSKKIKLL